LFQRPGSMTGMYSPNYTLPSKDTTSLPGNTPRQNRYRKANEIRESRDRIIFL
jgi:hypothetical protein